MIFTQTSPCLPDWGSMTHYDGLGVYCEHLSSGMREASYLLCRPSPCYLLGPLIFNWLPHLLAAWIRSTYSVYPGCLARYRS